ncbi:hypothetical protein F2Q69_00009075 [Brassica cretica]|uniref:Uncharacterized protein n=1 Tax=Brassica cretica TaxID=69181 RepID=A0A8S9PGE2_BRACR|nr:hypothetical protein F2Q69_00009075 [Brassica cretica]
MMNFVEQRARQQFWSDYRLMSLRVRLSTSVTRRHALRWNQALRAMRREVVELVHVEEPDPVAFPFSSNRTMREISFLRLDPRPNVSAHVVILRFETHVKVLVTRALAAAQEVVRCVLPESLKLNPEPFRVSVRVRGRSTPALPSVARIYGSDSIEKSDGSMNYVVELYDSALKEATSKLRHADKLARAKDVAIDRKTKEFKATIDKVAEDRAQLIERKKAQKARFLEKFGELKDKIEAAGAKVRGLEEEKKAEPTGRELGELPLQEGGIVGEVVRLEDTTIASASDPTTLSTSLVANEDPLVPVVETETGPVNLLEFSDSSTEEEGGEQLEKTESGLVGDPQNEEGAVDGTDNLPVLLADVIGEASDQLTAHVDKGGSDHVKD